MRSRLPAPLLLPAALHVPPTASSHPRALGIGRLAEGIGKLAQPAAAGPASHASCPATSAGGELDFGVRLSEKGRKEDLVFPPLPKGAPNAPWTPASHPASRETGGLHVVLMLRAVRASHLGPRGTWWWGVPHRQLPGGRARFISTGLVSVEKLLQRCAYPGRGHPDTKADTPNGACQVYL